MGWANRKWATLDGWQQLIVGSIVGTVIGAPVGAALSWAGGYFSLGFLTVAGRLLIDVFTNRLVIGMLIGGVFFGFGPPLWKSAKRLSRSDWFGLIFSSAIVLGIFWFIWLVGSQIYSSYANDPREFVAPATAFLNQDRSKRAFVTDSIATIEARYKDTTELAANHANKTQFGKWMAITGPLDDVSDDYNGVRLWLTGPGANAAGLYFDKKWLQQIVKIRQREWVFAVCKLTAASQRYIRLEECELVQRP